MPAILPDDEFGERIYAAVQREAGVALTEDDVRSFVRERLAHFKTPKTFSFVTELPKTATGKIQKFVLRGRRAAIAAQ